MDITFCDRCHESVPDADLESGRAVRLGGRVLHVPCALRRLSPGPGRVVLVGATLLALAGAGYAVWGRLESERGASARAETDAKRADDDARAIAARQDAWKSDLLAERAETRRELDAGFARVADATAAAAGAASGEVRAQLEGRLAAYREDVDRTHRRLDETDRRIEKISAWVEEVRALAARPPAPPAPEAPAAPPPVVPAARTTPEHDAELARWVEKLKDPDPSTSFSATYKLKDLKDLRAAGPLAECLRTHRDYYTRLGAASALMELRAADGVPALLDALDDKEELVQTQAADALLAITGHDVKWTPALLRKEKKARKDDWTRFWKENESAVRARLGQEKSAG